MTVSTNISSVRYQGNGVTNTFSFNGRIFTSSDLSVDIITRSTDTVVETLSISDYTVSLVSSESAEIVVSGPKIPSASQDILIYRNIDINQSLRLPTGTVFPASDVESALDRLTILIQDSQDDGSRSLVFPQNISGITAPYLPSPEDGKLLVWDGTSGSVSNLAVTNLIDEGFDTVFTGLIATDFLQYNGTSWVNIHNTDFPVQSIKAPTSSGTVLKNNSGTTILTIGPGGASSATFAGTLNIPDGTVSTLAKINSDVIDSLNESAVSIFLGKVIYGLTLSNNATDATNDIDIAVGNAVSTTGALLQLPSSMTKRLDASWAAGTNQGGLDTGAIANATYHLWLIKKDSDGSIDVLFSLSSSSPTMPSGYTAKCIIGRIIRTGGAIAAFKQIGRHIKLKEGIALLSKSGALTDGETFSSLVSNVIGKCSMTVNTAATAGAYYSLADNAQAGATNAQYIGGARNISSINGFFAGSFDIPFISGTMIFSTTNTTSSTLTIYLNGWEEI